MNEGVKVATGRLGEVSLPRRRIVVNDPRVVRFVAEAVGAKGFTGLAAIGMELDGEIAGGIVYDNYVANHLTPLRRQGGYGGQATLSPASGGEGEGQKGGNIFMHVAGRGKWLTKRLLWMGFDYPFNQLGLNRVSGAVAEDNIVALEFDKHLGFHEEARLKGAGPAGQDIVLLVMRKDECRWIKPRMDTNGHEFLTQQRKPQTAQAGID